MPDFDFTVETSVLLIELLTVTSSRKLVASTACPDFNFARLTSDALTVPLPVVSPNSTPIEIGTEGLLFPNESFTFVRLTVITCALLTPDKLTM